MAGTSMLPMRAVPVAAGDLEELAYQAAKNLPHGGLSRFQTCLPPVMAVALAARRVIDDVAAWKVLDRPHPILRSMN